MSKHVTFIEDSVKDINEEKKIPDVQFTSPISHKTTKSQKERRDQAIEYLFEEIGYGKYQYLMIVLTFLSISLDGIHLTLLSGMFIPIKTYFNIPNSIMELASSI